MSRLNLSSIDIGEIDFEGIDWIVIGTETGNRKGKSYSRPEWVLSIAEQAKAHGIPVFMKEDLLPIMGDERMIQELPETIYQTNTMNMDTIKEIDVKSVMTKILSAGGRIFGQPLCRVSPRLQVLLRIVHETVHRAHRAVGYVFRCKKLEADNESS